jgi:hypothetical protein
MKTRVVCGTVEICRLGTCMSIESRGSPIWLSCVIGCAAGCEQCESLHRENAMVRYPSLSTSMLIGRHRSDRKHPPIVVLPT